MYIAKLSKFRSLKISFQLTWNIAKRDNDYTVLYYVNFNNTI